MKQQLQSFDYYTILCNKYIDLQMKISLVQLRTSSFSTTGLSTLFSMVNDHSKFWDISQLKTQAAE